MAQPRDPLLIIILRENMSFETSQLLTSGASLKRGLSVTLGSHRAVKRARVEDATDLVVGQVCHS
jgi:hypothetical protein